MSTPIILYPGPPGLPRTEQDLEYRYSYRVRQSGGEFGPEIPYVSGTVLGIRNHSHDDIGYEVDLITRRYTLSGLEVLPELHRSVFFIIKGMPYDTLHVSIVSVVPNPLAESYYGGTIDVTLAFEGAAIDVAVSGSLTDLPTVPYIPLVTEADPYWMYYGYPAPEPILLENGDQIILETDGSPIDTQGKHINKALTFSKISPTLYRATWSLGVEEMRMDPNPAGVDLQLQVLASPPGGSGYGFGDTASVVLPAYWIRYSY